MGRLRIVTFMMIGSFFVCSDPQHNTPVSTGPGKTNATLLKADDYNEWAGQGALLLTRFHSLDEFKRVVQIRYADDLPASGRNGNRKPEVCLTYRSAGREISSILKSGISQADFLRVRNGSVWGKIWLGVRCPYAMLHRKDLVSIENLGRRRPPLFGKGDNAFYDLAETMVHHIREEDLVDLSCEDISEKGYLNTFNHITAQAFMTAMFNERMADFVADVHELYNMPELVTGHFTEKQLTDFENGPVDNYIDMINNEWGQELGKVLREKYTITRCTAWSPGLLADVLNDIQSYYSWAFHIAFVPFTDTDEMVIQFAWKINTVLAMD